MSDIVPIVRPIDRTAFGVPRAYSQIVPFTQSDGNSYLESVESLIAWVRDSIVPHLDKEVQDIVIAWTEQVQILIDAFNSNTDDTRDALDAAIAAVQKGQIPVTDPIILGIMQSVTSASRQYLDSLYGQGAMTDENLKRIITATVSQSRDYLDARYDARYDAAGAAFLVSTNLQTRYEPNKNFVDGIKGYWAPAPSGGDDTAVLQALLNQAATTNGILYLRAGTYLCNLATPAQFLQPWVIGTSRKQTVLRAFDKTKAVLKFRGGSGSLAGGGVQRLSIVPHADGGGDGLVFSGCGGVQARDVGIYDTGSKHFSFGLVFANELGNDFTEFCTFEGDIWGPDTAVNYRVLNGVESFHGSGLVGDTVLNPNSTSTQPMIWIQNNALPYNAPLTFDAFISNPNMTLIKNDNPNNGRSASFHGHISLEGNQGTNKQLCVSSNSRVFYMGHISHLGAGTTMLGDLFFVTKVTYEGGTIYGELAPVFARMQLKNSPTVALVGCVPGGSFADVSIKITAPNYDYAATFTVYQSPYNDGGAILDYQVGSNIDNTGQAIGAPTISWSGYGLYVSNSKYTTNFKADVSVVQRGGARAGSLMQNLYT